MNAIRRPSPAVLLLLVVSLATAPTGCAWKESGSTESASTSAAPAPPPVAGETTAPAVRAGGPIEGYLEVDRARLERERLDASWRTAAEADRTARHAVASRRASVAAGVGGGAAPVERMRAVVESAGDRAAGDAEPPAETSAAPAAESWESISPTAFTDFSPTLPVPQEGGGPTVLALQWMLDRVGFSPGVIDGRWGKNTGKAVYWLQESLGLPATGVADRRLWDLLSGQVGGNPPLREYSVAAADVEGPFVDIPDDPYAQAELDCLCYASAAEAVAERFHATADLLALLNPEVDLDALAAGDRLWVPAVEVVTAEAGQADRVAEIVISHAGFYLQALDEAGRVLYHFPATLGSSYDPSPEGALEVTGIAYRPTYHYQPEVLDDVPDDEEDAVLPPGANSPVGLVWMQLSKDTYGIHGTAAPETIGYASSHGCVRLTNWDALALANRTAQGTPVRFVGA